MTMPRTNPMSSWSITVQLRRRIRSGHRRKKTEEDTAAAKKRHVMRQSDRSPVAGNVDSNYDTTSEDENDEDFEPTKGNKRPATPSNKGNR